MKDPANRRPNRLAQETSPYLLQHAHNPVEWYGWGNEALERSRREEKPIFLSIGYSACHWCHVMEVESFENEEIAKVMNEHFINIKVDREERPDLDNIYMSAVQLMTQHGGWPMSVFLTPDLEPFYGGTYFPPEDRGGMPSFKRILLGVAAAWQGKRTEVLSSAKQLSSALIEMGNPTSDQPGKLSLDLVDNAIQRIKATFDPDYGGFGSAPKFFHTMDLRLALRQWKRTGDKEALKVVTTTLDKISDGGIYDHLGGGFHRYSTDRFWLAPHFEKMLYDNALLSEVFLEALQATGSVEYARVARETLNYVLREMTSPEGGFFSTQDADSEGVEGKFYVWSKAEIEENLDPELAGLVCQIFDVSEKGNWEETNILNRKHSLDEWAKTLKVDRDWLDDSLATAQRKLFMARSSRITPLRDEKVILAWNGMMIHSFALGYQTLGDDRYLAAAEKAVQFVWEKLCEPTKATGLTLLHVYKDGRAKITGFLDDYAAYLNSLLSLYECRFDGKTVVRAVQVADALLAHFWEASTKTFYFTSLNHEKLLSRPRELHDGATPSATSLAITALLRLGKLVGRTDYVTIAESALAAMEENMRNLPAGNGQAIIALSFLFDKPIEVVIAPGESSDDTESVLQQIRSRFIPNKVVAMSDEIPTRELAPLTRGKQAIGGKVTVYFCENFACQAPLAGVEKITEALATK